jgi:uncharacterized membrane protein
VNGTAFQRIDIWLAVAVVVAMVLGLINLGDAALWLDEVDTAKRIQLSWHGVLDDVFFGNYGAQHLPVYFLLLKGWSALFGESAWALRSLSAILSVVTVAATAWIALVIADRRAARWAAWLAAISPYLLHHAQEARMYSMMGAGAAVATLLLTRYLMGQTHRLGFGFVLACLALVGTHYYGVFLVGGLILALLIKRPRPVVSWLASCVVVTAGCVLVVVSALLLTSRRSGAIYDIDMLVVPGLVWSMLSGYTLVPGSQDLHAEGMRAALPYIPIALAAMAPFAFLAYTGIRTLVPTARLIILMSFAATVAGPLLAYIVFPGASIHPRYTITGGPALLVLLGVGASTTIHRLLFARISAVFLCGLMVVGSVRHLSEPGHGRIDIPAAGFWLDQHVPVEHTILVTSEDMETLARFHWPNRHVKLYPPANVVATRDNADDIVQSLPRLEHKKVYYLFGRAWHSDPKGFLRMAIERQFELCEGANARGVRIMCLEVRNPEYPAK